jgi:uncharacterized RDD family membrane protein YckC
MAEIEKAAAEPRAVVIFWSIGAVTLVLAIATDWIVSGSLLGESWYGGGFFALAVICFGVAQYMTPKKIKSGPGANG